MQNTNHTSMDELITDRPIDVKSFDFGDIVSGVVVEKTGREILIDLGGKSEGIITGKELSEGYKTYEALQIGDPVMAYVIDPEDSSGYVVLSLKRAEAERKWIDFEKFMEDKTSLECEIIDTNKGGLIVMVQNTRGFIPVSHIDRSHFPDVSNKMASGTKTEKDEVLTAMIGEKILGVVIEVNKLSSRLILSEKAANAHIHRERRFEALKGISVGDEVTGKITTIMPFGIFVDLNGVEGLIHVSEVGWGKVGNLNELYNLGDIVTTKVVSINAEEGKISLSLKELLPDPWLKANLKVGDMLKGTVSKITPYGAFVHLENDLDGLIHISETTGPLASGQEIEARVLAFEPAEHKLGLSLKDGETTAVVGEIENKEAKDSELEME